MSIQNMYMNLLGKGEKILRDVQVEMQYVVQMNVSTLMFEQTNRKIKR